MATISERLAYVLTFDTSSGVKSLNKLGATADKELGKAEKKLDKMSAGLTKFGAGAVAFAGLAGAGLVKVAMGASDLEESVNAVRVTFGEAGEGILKLGRDAAKAVGMSNVEFNGLAVQFSSFAEKVAGEGGDVVQTMADMTGRAADFASVMNIDVAQAATIFQSGLAGETEPLKKFGIDLSAAAVGAFAVANGISESTSSMSEAEKVQARYGLLMEQTAKTAGDFANTSDGMANQQRILKAEFKNLSDNIGAGVLPMLTELVGVAGKAVGAFSRLSPEVQGTIGKFAALGVAGTSLIGTMSFVAGQAIKMRGNFTTLGADGSRSLTKMGKAAKGVGVAMGVAAVAMALYALEARGAARNTARFNDSLTFMAETDFTDFEAGSAAIAEFLTAMANDKSVKTQAEAFEKLAREQPAAAAAIAGTTEGVLLSSLGMDELKAAIEKVATAQAQAKINEENYAASVNDTTDAVDGATEALGRVPGATGRGTDALQDLKEEIEENRDEILGWADDVQASTESGAESFGDFSEDALKSIGAFQDELNTTSSDVNTWQNNLITVASQTSPEFAGYLADMGIAGAGLVEDLAGNEGELETTFANYQMFAAVSSRDMVAEFAAVAPGVAEELDKVGTDGVVALELARDRMMAEARKSKAVGTEVGNGVRSGIREKAEVVAAAAGQLVRDAVARAKKVGRIKSPSRLFAEEVGQPIAQGVAEGVNEDAYKVADALSESIEGAQEDAVKVAHDLADSVLDEFQAISDSADDVLSGLFDAIDAEDKIEGLSESVSDAEQSLTDAQQNLNDVRAEETSTREDIRKAIERESDAQERLRDANMALTEETIENSIGTDAQREAWSMSAEAAGLTAAQIRDLAEAYKAAMAAQEELAVATANQDQVKSDAENAIAAEAAAANQLNDRFREAAGAGLVLDSDFEALANLNGSPGQQLALQQSILDRIADFFANPPAPPPSTSRGRGQRQADPMFFASGTNNAPGGPAFINERGAELVTLPSGAKVATAAASKDLMAGVAVGATTFNITVNAGMGADGATVGNKVIEMIKAYERRNGNGWRS